MRRLIAFLVPVVLLAACLVPVAAPTPPAGHLGWVRQFGSAGREQAMGVAVDGVGNVYVAGRTGASLPDQRSMGGEDAFLRKYDPAGRELWTRQFGNADSDVARGVAADGAGNVYVVGQTIGALPGQTSVGGRDAFLRKYDPAGQEMWTRQFGDAGSDTARSVAVDRAGDVYVRAGH